MIRHGALPEFVLPLLLALSSGFAAPATGEAQREAEEVVRRHQESLGPTERLRGWRSFQAEGMGRLEIITGGSGQVQGPVTLLGDGEKFRLSIVFGINEYPAEEVAYDGQKVEVGQIQPGVRSVLGQFLKQFERIVSDGLLGGVLSTHWVLRDVKARGAELRYEGLKKIDDREYHTLRYRKRGYSVETRLYFDLETFRHIHTLYRVRISSPLVMANPDASADQPETWYTLKESFGGFGSATGLTLPSRWTLEFTREIGREGSVLRYTIQLVSGQINPVLHPDQFQLD